MGTAKLSDLVHRLRALKDEKERLEADLKSVNKEAKYLQEVTLPELMEVEDIEKASIEGAGTIYLKQEFYVSLTGMDPNDPTSTEPPFYDWAREHAPDLVREFVHPSRLKAWSKEMLQAGKPLPSNMIRTTFVPTATLLRK